MSIVVLLAIILLGVLLYKLLSSPEQTYAYTRTMIISFKPDGTEEISSQEESGIIFIGRKTVTIDGEAYRYKSSGRKKIQAKLNFDGGSLKSVRLSLNDDGEKLFYVDKIHNVKEAAKH